MPLARYFLLIGGALLALLFIADTSMPTAPAGKRANSIPITIRIRSDVKWPKRVIYDTSLPTIIPTQTASAENHMSEPTTTVPDGPIKARKAFAQLPPSNSIQSPSDASRQELKPQHPRKPARKRTAPAREFLVARQTHFGWFGYSAW